MTLTTIKEVSNPHIHYVIKDSFDRGYLFQDCEVNGWLLLQEGDRFHLYYSYQRGYDTQGTIYQDVYFPNEPITSDSEIEKFLYEISRERLEEEKVVLLSQFIIGSVALYEELKEKEQTYVAEMFQGKKEVVNFNDYVILYQGLINHTSSCGSVSIDISVKDEIDVEGIKDIEEYKHALEYLVIREEDGKTNVEDYYGFGPWGLFRAIRMYDRKVKGFIFQR